MSAYITSHIANMYFIKESVLLLFNVNIVRVIISDTSLTKVNVFLSV